MCLRLAPKITGKRITVPLGPSMSVVALKKILIYRYCEVRLINQSDMTKYIYIA